MSASAWLTACDEFELGESDLCIGHGPASEQQAIRASGVAIQPAHTATLPADSATVTRSAESRLLRISTDLRMLEIKQSVKRGPSPGAIRGRMRLARRRDSDIEACWRRQP